MLECSALGQSNGAAYTHYAAISLCIGIGQGFDAILERVN